MGHDVVEAVRNDPVGMDLISINGQPDDLTITTCIGITAEQSAIQICCRAHELYEAISQTKDSSHPQPSKSKSAASGKTHHDRLPSQATGNSPHQH
ncbi:hypothetical protein [Subtercola vilae]|uniref:hypothetical protein n=1 Tax=Subtercola vilae TaxID=2056433 RepID=UPI0010A9A487|nr:hypothetical protein [Subtercola vilae]